MNDWTGYLDELLFAVLPYVALVTLVLVTIQSYRAAKFTYSSLSSQFLENKQHFWGLVPFHYGILVVIGGHVVAFLIPRGCSIPTMTSSPASMPCETISV